MTTFLLASIERSIYAGGMEKAVAIIVAAGSGARVGGAIPKQFRTLLGQPVIAWSVQAFRRHSDIGQIIIVQPENGDTAGIDLQAYADLVVTGGATRAQSVLNGLKALDVPEETPVLIHDAARPGLSQQIITALLSALQTADGAAPALKVSDAVKDTAGKHLKTVERETLRRIQTPQAFHLGVIRDALNTAEGHLVDDLAAIERLGKKVTLVRGDEKLGKITYEDDFDMVAKLMSPLPATPRIGSGYDVHQFGPGDHVTLCGVKIPHAHGLVGHSDADIGWHALTDAILGALALGDIGDHFPPSDPQWKDADSSKFLAFTNTLAREAGYAISNVDITLICEAPKIKPHREAMRQRTAEVLQLPASAISVKATTTEQLGFTGRGEGMAGQAVAVLTPVAKAD